MEGNLGSTFSTAHSATLENSVNEMEANQPVFFRRRHAAVVAGSCLFKGHISLQNKGQQYGFPTKIKNILNHSYKYEYFGLAVLVSYSILVA